jgi:hypothetical protein
MNAIDFSMWGRALKTIPRISKEEWMRIDIVFKMADCNTFCSFYNDCDCRVNRGNIGLVQR